MKKLNRQAVFYDSLPVIPGVLLFAVAALATATLAVATLAACVVPAPVDRMITLEAKPAKNLVPQGSDFTSDMVTVTAFYNTGDAFHIAPGQWEASEMPDSVNGHGEMEGWVRFGGETDRFSVYVYTEGETIPGDGGNGGDWIHIPLEDY